MLAWLLLCAALAQRTVTGEAEISDDIFTGDSAESGGSIFHSGNCDTSSTLTVTKCVFYGIKATSGSGGAIYSDNCGLLVVNNCEFRTCSASVSGGAVYCAGSPSCTLKGNTVIDGLATEPGGAFYIKAENVAVEGCNVTKCTGGSAAAAIWIRLEGSPDGVLSFKSNIIENSMDDVDCVVLPFCNLDEVYTQLYWEVFNCTFDSGGHTVRKFVSLQELFVELTIKGCHFKNINLLERGGAFCGLIVENENYIEVLSIVDSTFAKIQGTSGGAIFAGSIFDLIVRNCSFADCHSKDEGAVVSIMNKLGGGITLQHLDIDRCGDDTGCCICCVTDEPMSTMMFIASDLTFSDMSGKSSSIIYISSRHGTSSYFSTFTFLRCSFIDVAYDQHVGLVDLYTQELIYSGCIFERARNDVGSGLLVAARTSQGSLNARVTAKNCTFVDCHCSSGNIIFAFKNTRAVNWDVTVTDCRFSMCSSKSAIVSLGESDTAEGVIKTVELTDTEIVECNSESAIIKLTPRDNCVFESNVVNVSSKNTIISLPVKDKTFRLFNCSLGEATSPSSKPYIAISNDNVIETVELEECKAFNNVLDDPNVFLFITPRPANLNELRISDCVFDTVVSNKASMITQVNTLWINGSSFCRCSSTSGVIHLENQSPDLVISNCVFDENVHSTGGAGQSIYLEFLKDAAVGSFVISGCTFSNHVGRCSVSIRLAAQVTSVDIQDCYFEGDKVTGTSDGVINIAGDGLGYQLSNCTFSRCSIESTTGVVAISTISPSAAVFSKLNLSHCQFDACSSGRYVLLSVTGQNGPVAIEYCSFANGSVALELSCDTLSIHGSTFISEGSPSQSVIRMSSRGDCAFADSTFIFSGASENIKYPMIESSGSVGSVVSFSDCCFSSDRGPAASPAFLYLSGKCKYVFQGDMCFDRSLSASILKETDIEGVKDEMFDCDTCKRSVDDPTPDPTGGDTQNKGMHPAGIAGIAILLLLLIILVVLLALYLIRRRRRRQTWSTTEEKDDPEETITTLSETSGESQDGVFQSEENPLFRSEALGVGPSFEEHYALA